MYMRMPVETTAIRVDGAEDTGFQPPFSGGIQQILHRQTARHSAATVAFEHRPQRVRQGERPDVPSRSQEDDSAVLLSTGLWPSFRRTGRHGCRMSWSGTLRADSPGYHTRTLLHPVSVCRNGILVTASTSISRRPPASGKDVQHWLAVNRRFRGRGVKPDNMRMD